MTTTERQYELDRVADRIERLRDAGRDTEASRMLARWRRGQV